MNSDMAFYPNVDAKELSPVQAGANGRIQENPQHNVSSSKTKQSSKLFKPSSWLDKLKGSADDQDSDWWFASTAIPLLAATLGPLANVLSIGALVTSWRMNVVDPDGNSLEELDGIPFADPRWCYWLNVVSLIMGFIGNFFLLMNFTQRIRYIIALPATIILWYIATGILIGILASMEIYVPPNRPHQTYSQGFWYGIAAASIYLLLSMLLMVNMLGYFLGHYPQEFELSDHQRTLILQTMLFFVWLAGGGGVFSRVETDAGSDGWRFTDAMYFCDVTILTVGFGDLAPSSNVGRGLVFPYSVVGIIMLGLVINSIHNFVQELGADKVIKGHFEKTRMRTWDRTVTTSRELKRRKEELPREVDIRRTISTPFNAVNQSISRKISNNTTSPAHAHTHKKRSSMGPIIKRKKPRLLLLREEKDRFDAMRRIQRSTSNFKKWWRLSMSVIAVGILWAVGACVFWQAEQNTQQMTYFQALYFCYVSLLTIGYGDLSPKSNAGRCFFVVWSLIAVPTMTILVSDMGNTIISKFKEGTFKLADFTVLPKEGIWRKFLEGFPFVRNALKSWSDAHARKEREKRGIPGPLDEDLEDADASPPDLETLAAEEENDIANKDTIEHDLARKLAHAIRRTARDMQAEHPKRYTYEEWAEFTRLIRFTTDKDSDNTEDESLVEWDWIGEDSPMMARQGEPEFVLDRLCESLSRYMKKTPRALQGHIPEQIEPVDHDRQDFGEQNDPH